MLSQNASPTNVDGLHYVIKQNENECQAYQRRTLRNAITATKVCICLYPLDIVHYINLNC